ncbi:MAG: ABC transporter ATP-binding protein [Rhodospirillales bacterium]|jgi:iron(III) transport system ATP-binding protein|nr:ABC transporter ATP-binding protein [Rhodospirillales bacterium]MBT4007279.1 ABC transporter ATP-binding protein [Rhodospirillales bacterium]MBT5077016.1 ABC transporter ATP-binding protein [Rhodospirillales bacterium]MBT5113612.1 ABC transporter ATP-binding protein [Rhodospirillales bacterium]MBT5673910.1 ABC transporter ATP-binding protein [Rhodospirillales bacterium]
MLTIEALEKTFITRDGSTVAAVGGVSLELDTGNLLTLLGPSGCGKTTTLRSVAGLEKPDAGRIIIDGTIVFDAAQNINVPANRRGIGMVFQSYAIWPHMSVFENVAFPMRVSQDQKYTNGEIEKMVARALEMVRLEGYEKRSSTQLSGGQQQRLALARGLVREPKLLLLDEPLSNLDAKLREQMRFELKRLQLELDITTLYVTHDQGEALALSNEIAVMNSGHVIQRGAPYDIYHKPITEFVAGFVGSTNFLRGFVESAVAGDGMGTVATPHGIIRCLFSKNASLKDDIIIVIRPEDVVLSDKAPAEGGNHFEGKITNRIFLGEVIDYLIEAGDEEIRVRANPECDFEIGAMVNITLPPDKCVGLAEAGEIAA